VPREILNDGWWLHPSRLPLGAGWSGACCASGGETPAEEAHIREFCNLGYATSCPHLPEARDWDAVRFCIARSSDEQITLHYTCERSHAPVVHGTLTYELKTGSWREAHSDARINRLATSYLQAYRVRLSKDFI
jgi:hypothetical protein